MRSRRPLLCCLVLLAFFCSTAAAQAPGSFKVPRNTERAQIQGWIKAACAAHKLDPFLVQAVMEVESGWDVLAVSPKGAQGLMQIMPQTGAGLGLDAPFDPKANIMAGSKYLKEQLNTFGDVQLALAAYNAGPQAVRKCRCVPPFGETQRYVTAVASRFLKLKTGSNLDDYLKKALEGHTPKGKAYP